MKKIITTMMVIVILFNFILCNKSYAFEGINSIAEPKGSVMESVINGVAGGLKLPFDFLGAIFGVIAGILAIVLDLFPMLIQFVLTVTVGKNFTIKDTVFNQYALFDINYFNFNNTYTVGNSTVATISANTAIKTLKTSVAKFFLLTKLIAIAFSLVVLIYVGIRMALSSISSDKAKYKSMLISWFESVLILFILQYIISILLNIGNIFTNLAFDFKTTLENNDNSTFEVVILNKIFCEMITSAGWTYVLYSVAYWFLVFLQVKFYLMYLKRVIAVGFLIIIAPLITMTYSIDKIGDGKAQAFSVWFNELAMNIFIQPIHAFIYLVFMYSAGEIAKYSIIISLVFLLGLTKVEKMILYLFDLKNVVSLKPVDDQKKKEK